MKTMDFIKKNGTGIVIGICIAVVATCAIFVWKLNEKVQNHQTVLGQIQFSSQIQQQGVVIQQIVDLINGTAKKPQ